MSIAKEKGVEIILPTFPERGQNEFDGFDLFREQFCKTARGDFLL